jgi:hypothetical protein
MATAQVSVEEIMQAAALPMVARHLLTVSHGSKADFHQFGLMSGRTEACRERALQGGQQARGVLRRFVDGQRLRADARCAPIRRDKKKDSRMMPSRFSSSGEVHSTVA